MELKRKYAISGWLVLILPALLLSGCAGKLGWRQKPYELTVLHTNDVHGGYGGLTKEGHTCYMPYCEDGKGGSVRLQQAVRAIRRDMPNVVLLDAGDEFQGTLYSTVYKEVMPPVILNKIGYDVFVPGNHEFDYGCESFFTFVRSLEMPLVAANLVVSSSGEDKIQPWAILERNGRRIGVVGLVTTETPNISSPCGDLLFTDEETALRRAVAELTEQDVDIIIALTHTGFEADKKLARSVSGVDVIVGGHSHTLLSNTQPKAAGPYPAVEKSPDGEPVLVVTAGNGGAFLGRLNVTFDGRGVATQWDGDTILLNDASLMALGAPAPDTDLVGTMEEYSGPVQSLLRKKLGRINAAGRKGKPLEANIQDCREAECLSGNVVADSILRVAFPEARAALINSGSMRSSLPGGTVTVGDVMACLPYQNPIVMADMPGSVLLEMLEHSLSRYGEGHGSFLQTAGLRFTFDSRKEPGNRLLKVEIRNRKGKWQKVNPEKSYRVATLKFLADGGDGYTMLKGLSWLESKILLNDAVRIHLETHSPVKAGIEKRIRRKP